MNLSRWVDALLSSPITSGTPRFLEHSVLGRLSAWEVAATGELRATRVPAWWREALELAGGTASLSATESWWRPWRDERSLELAWNRVRGGLEWVHAQLPWGQLALPPRVLTLCAASTCALSEPSRFPHPEAFEAEVEQLLRCAELLLAAADPTAPRPLAGLLHAARRASQGLRSPVTLHLPLSDVREVSDIVRERSAAPVPRVQEAYARVVFYGAQLRDRCEETFGVVST